MLGLLSQPKPQSADTAILTLCDRISHSLLIEDRKAAVLALRGLAHDNRELVASNGLQGLFDVLTKDYHDPDAAKATLETLLILFNTETRRKVRNRKYISPLIQRDLRERSVEPSDGGVVSDISLWLTDRLLHNEEALHRVLELTTTRNDPFTAVYALQLISVMVTNRSTETKQIMLSSGGIAPLVTAFGSVQDMVRDEALLLLNALTTDNLDLQKLVAFEGGFDKAFDILSEGGGVFFGGRVAEDCLSLIANLIEYNTSNQKLFTQSGYVSRWIDLIESIIDALGEGTTLREQSVSNIEATLAISQLLCVSGADHTEGNQNVLCKFDALTLTLRIAFGPNSPPAVRVAALITVASLINENQSLQDDFLAMDVPYYDLSIRKVVPVEPKTIPVSQALLNWAVSLSASHLFDLRCASLLCLSSAFNENNPAKAAFVSEQIEKYKSLQEDIAPTADSNTGDAAKPNSNEQNNGAVAKKEDTDSSFYDHQDVNLVEVLAEYSDETRLNPFRIWFASSITMRLFINDAEIKDQLRKVNIGEESLGMEVHSLIQAIAGEMQGAMQYLEPTAALGYLQLLAVWIYDDIEAVNEFTRESSAVQTLLAHQTNNALVESLAAIVLGIAYAFSTAQSPIPRSKFHELLTQTLGRDQYMLLVRRFRQSHTFQSFDEGDMFGAPRDSNGSPAVYLDAAFVGLMTESIGYISRAIDANPNIEPSTRVTLEMLDEVKHSLHLKSQSLETAEHKLSETSKECRDLKKKLENSFKQVAENETLSKESQEKLTKAEQDLKTVNEKAEKLEADLKKTKTELDNQTASLTKLEASSAKQSSELTTLKAAKDKAEDGVNNLTRELFQLQRAKESSEKENSKLQSEVSKLKPKLESSLKSEAELKKKLQESQSEAGKSAKSLEETKKINEKLVAKLRETVAVLEKHEEEEEKLKEQLSKLKLQAESQENEFRTLKNREATSRKSHEKVAAELEKLKSSQENQAASSSSMAAEITTLKTTLETLTGQLRDAKSAEEKANSGSKLLEKKLQESEAQLKESKDAAEKNVQTLQNSNDKLKEMNTKFVKEIAELKKAAKAQKESAPKSEASPAKDAEITSLKDEVAEKQGALDELLILLDDLTEKKTSYKNRLRAMKQDVSDSEDEDEDDNEEDEEDEDEKDEKA